MTLGSWSTCATDASNDAEGADRATDLFADECLVRAGGEPTGVLDVRSAHAYPKQSGGTAFHGGGPLHREASSFGLRSPIFLGEISTRWDDQHTYRKVSGARGLWSLP